MKNVILTFLLMFATTYFANAKIWRINNNPDISADFTTAQSANNSASVQSGDTLHLEPSLISYGSLNLSKQLVVFGTGHFNTYNPGYQANTNEAKLGSVTIGTSGSGSVLSIKYTGFLNLINTSNVKLISCVREEVIFMSCSPSFNTGENDVVVSNSTNCNIQGCFVSKIAISNSSTNILVSNTFIVHLISVDNSSSSIINQNIIQKLPNSCNFEINNSTVKNNIFLETGANFNNCNVYNNYATSTILPTVAGDGNVNLVSILDIFNPFPSGVPYNYVDNFYLIKSGSSALTAGDAGQQIGLFGGATPLKLALQPAIPSIHKLEVPAQTVGNTMNVIFSTRSN